MSMFTQDLEQALGGAVKVTPEAEDAELAWRYLAAAGALDCADALGLT